MAENIAQDVASTRVKVKSRGGSFIIWLMFVVFLAGSAAFLARYMFLTPLEERVRNLEKLVDPSNIAALNDAMSRINLQQSSFEGRLLEIEESLSQLESSYLETEAFSTSPIGEIENFPESPALEAEEEISAEEELDAGSIDTDEPFEAPEIDGFNAPVIEVDPADEEAGETLAPESQEESQSPSESDSLARSIRENSEILKERMKLQKTLSLVLATTQLRDAVLRAERFDGQLKQVQMMASDAQMQQELSSLSQNNEDGVLSTIELQNGFYERIQPILSASSSEVAQKEGWSDTMMKRLKDVVRVRKVGSDVAGDSPEAVIARAEHLVKREKFNAAIMELQRLKGEAYSQAKPWVDQAKLYLGSRRAVENLYEQVTKIAYADVHDSLMWSAKQ